MKALLDLHSIADQASAGFGIRPLELETTQLEQSVFDHLQVHGTLATIHADRARILPKRHTPDVGMTLRSLSTKLAYHRSSLLVRWETEGPSVLRETIGDQPTSLSIVLCPWPLDVSATDFTSRLSKRDPGVGSFTYSPARFFDQHLLSCTIEAALHETPHVDMVVFPEMALHGNEVNQLRGILERFKVNTYVAGLRSWKGAGGNYVQLGFVKNRALTTTLWDDNSTREKHHPWRLDGRQIRNYQLGGALHPPYSWWETLRTERREVTFVNLGTQLTVCPLICEDLARQDDLAELLRATGPSLVVAVLQDGPQLRHRWPAKYASVLGDDPGSAVLTLTCYGMVKRYAREGHLHTSNCIALWSERSGHIQEISLETGAKAVLLTLVVEFIPDPSGMAKAGPHGTYSLSLGGVAQLRA